MAMKIRFVGNADSTQVIGLGVFKYMDIVTIDEPGKMALATALIESNPNFEDCTKEKETKGDK